MPIAGGKSKSLRGNVPQEALFEGDFLGRPWFVFLGFVGTLSAGSVDECHHVEIPNLHLFAVTLPFFHNFLHADVWIWMLASIEFLLPVYYR